MDIEYLRTARNSYMIVKNAEYEFENYELQMILHNEIPSLLGFQVIVGDGEAEYWYDVTGMLSMEQQFPFLTLGEQQLRFFLQNFIYVKNAMEEYLLDDRNLSFSPSLIFYDRFAKRLRFCYIPGLAKHPSGDIQSLFEVLLQHLDHSDPEAVRLGYDMYERCTQSEFLVEDCIDCLTNSREEKGAWISDTQRGQGDGCPSANDEERDDMDLESPVECPDYALSRAGGRFGGERETTGRAFGEKRATSAYTSETNSAPEKKTGKFWKRKWRQKRRMPIDYSDILDEEQRRFYAAEEIQTSQETEIFSAREAGTGWKLIYKGDGDEPDLALTDFPFWIGTDREKVQGVLTARTVSRVHAKVFLREERLYLEDYNSTNGTYVNQRMVPMNTPIELHPGDHIFLATEEYLLTCRGF